MTARNMQDAVKKKGLPWSAAKGFDTFNPISSFIEKSKISDTSNVRLWLKTNDQTRQDGNTKDMIFDIPQLIEHVSSIMTIEEGDLLLTGASIPSFFPPPFCHALLTAFFSSPGTPKGVGSVKAGDLMHAGLEVEGKGLLAELRMNVKNREGGFEFKEG